jgi:hypothetical protein
VKSEPELAWHNDDNREGLSDGKDECTPSHPQRASDGYQERVRVAAPKFRFGEALGGTAKPGCCYGPGYNSGTNKNCVSGGGECGALACVSIGVDSTSTQCSPYGFDPWMLTNRARRGATVTYKSVSSTSTQTPTTTTHIAGPANIFLGCGQSVNSPGTMTSYVLVKADMDQSSSLVRRAFLRLVSQSSKTQLPQTVSDTPDLDIQTCTRLCDQASGKCLNVPADTWITKDQETGLSKLFDSAIKTDTKQIDQSTLLKMFGMTEDPCSRFATEFRGDESGSLKNIGLTCTMAFVRSNENTRLLIPESLAGTYKRDSHSITVMFNEMLKRASLQTDSAESFTRRDVTGIYAIPGRIIAATGDKCIDFRYSQNAGRSK